MRYLPKYSVGFTQSALALMTCGLFLLPITGEAFSIENASLKIHPTQPDKFNVKGDFDNFSLENVEFIQFQVGEFSQSIPVEDFAFNERKNEYTFKGARGQEGISRLVLDFRRGKLSALGEGLDLSGVDNPVKVRLVAGESDQCSLLEFREGGSLWKFSDKNNPQHSCLDATVTDSAGRKVEALPKDGTALMELSGLTPFGQYDITIKASSGDEVSYLRLTADGEGNIPLTAILYDMEADEYTYVVVALENGQTLLEGSFSVTASAQKVEIVNDQGNPTRTFIPGSEVYVLGNGFEPLTEVDLYVVNDEIVWTDGMVLRDVSGSAAPTSDLPPWDRVPEDIDLLGTPERVEVDADGNVPVTNVWAIPGGLNTGYGFDVVVDVNRNGLFDPDIDLVNEYFSVGFTVQEAAQADARAPGADFNAELASDAALGYRDIFQPDENIYAYINPKTRLTLGGDRYVRKYVVVHKDTWNNGDALIDISGPNNPWEADTVQSGCTNEGRVLVWPAPLIAGEYDIVLDVNRNSVYDEGIDVLDGGPGIPGFTVVGEQPLKDWTVLVYINADNDLESAGIDDINEMEIVGSSDNVNIVVQIDRIPGYDSSNGDWHTARRYYITQDSDPATISSPLVADIGEIDMGSATTLQDFAVWGAANYPADHYLIVVWDHGNGFRRSVRGLSKNISWDTTSGGTSISIPQLSSTMDNLSRFLGKDVDILGMDACLMAMAEISYEMRDSTDYVVASEDTEPNDGWPYDLFLRRMVDSPQATPETVAGWIARDYATSYPSMEVTQSAMDLSTMKDLGDAVDGLARAMIDGMQDPQDGAALRDALQTIVDNTLSFSDGDFRDLYRFAELVSQAPTMPAEITAPADAVMLAVNDSVIENAVNGASFANAHGLTIWLPNAQQFNNFVQRYGRLLFPIDTDWDKFLAELWGVSMRIELTWGLNPGDLDSHLWDIYGNHLYYPYAGQGGSPIPGAWLDLDDVTSYGPENIRIESWQIDLIAPYDSYVYGVFLYSGSNSTEPVYVKVFRGADVVPSNVFTKPGFDSSARWWTVFEVDPQTRQITGIDSTGGSGPRFLSSEILMPPKKPAM